MARSLDGRAIVITGATSGIGAATALACARAGMDLVLHGRRAERLADLARRIGELGRAAEVVCGDVAAPGESERLLDAAERRFGRFDAVLANAGYGLNRAVHELDPTELRRIFDVNFFAPTELLALAGRRLLGQRRRGHLLMTASTAGKFPLPDFAAYTTTKAAQIHVCHAMRMELRPRGIDVSVVLPVTTRTEFFEAAARMSGAPAANRGSVDRLPRWLVQSPERVAAAIVACLRRPVPEVWTSGVVRAGVVLADLFPRFLDLVGHAHARR
jgi:short-subunit dehydrogenase